MFSLHQTSTHLENIVRALKTIIYAHFLTFLSKIPHKMYESVSLCL